MVARLARVSAQSTERTFIGCVILGERLRGLLLQPPFLGILVHVLRWALCLMLLLLLLLASKNLRLYLAHADVLSSHHFLLRWQHLTRHTCLVAPSDCTSSEVEKILHAELGGEHLLVLLLLGFSASGSDLLAIVSTGSKEVIQGLQTDV